MSAIVRTRAEPWPEADALFHRDPRWLGSDDAYSVPLGGDRTLWLFGDTFVARAPGEGRRDAAFVRNSIAIQDGSDPSRAKIAFHWGSSGTDPASFFSTSPGTWLWPLHGVRLGSVVTLFFMQVRSPSGSPMIDPIAEWRALGPLGFFDVFGWVALIVENPDDPPDAWGIRRVAMPSPTAPVVLGAGLLVEDGWLYAYGWDEAKRIHVARWPVERAASGDLRTPSWWDGTGWADEPTGAAVIEEGATEFTVHRDGDRYVQTQVVPGAQALALRDAERPEGPWSAPIHIFIPEEAARPDAFVYAGKAHPHLTGADLVLTYASVAAADVTLEDETLYYPRFVRVSGP